MNEVDEILGMLDGLRRIVSMLERELDRVYIETATVEDLGRLLRARYIAGKLRNHAKDIQERLFEVSENVFEKYRENVEKQIDLELRTE